MNHYIILLRGINVGGHNKLPMQELRDLLIQNGYTDVKTYIQTGNIFLSSPKVKIIAIAAHISSLIEVKFKYQLTVLGLTGTEIDNCLLKNPFLKVEEDFKKIHVIFLNKIPNNALVEEIKNFKSNNDSFTVIDKFIYIHYPDNSRNSKLSIAFFEKKLQVKASARNWKTVLKLDELKI